MKNYHIAFGSLAVLGLLVFDTTFASGGFRNRAPQVISPPKVSAPVTAPTTNRIIAPAVSTPVLSRFDQEVKQKLEARGLELPNDWTSWTQAKQNSFLADLDFVKQENAATNIPTPTPVVNNTVRGSSLDQTILSTLSAQNLGVPSTFSRWSDHRKRSFLKSLNRPDTRQRVRVTAPVEEVLSPKDQAEYDQQQAVAQAAQAERLAVLKSETLIELAAGSLQSGPGKSAGGNFTIEAKGDEVMITLADNFNVSNGPDLFVTLTSESVAGKRSLDAQQLITLDALASTNGKQVYTVSKADFDKYGKSLVIWCKAYNVVFGATTID